jgi:hypothetical protein
MIMLRVYADESHAGQEKKPAAGFYVAAGWISRIEEWEGLEKVWREALDDCHLTAFHMSPCEKGVGEFKVFSCTQRQEMQAQFIRIIKSYPILGVACAVALKPFRKYEPRFRERMAVHLHHFVEPHVFALHGIVVSASRAVALQNVPGTEQIEFILDRQVQFQGRVEDLWFGGTMRSGDTPRREYLGTLTHADKRTHLGLQAADILAYEEFRFRSGDRDRWQMAMLQSGGQVFSEEIMSDSFFKIALSSLRNESE